MSIYRLNKRGSDCRVDLARYRLPPERQHPVSLIERTVDMLVRRWVAFDPNPEATVRAAWETMGVPGHLAASLVRTALKHLAAGPD
jgi:hypothetical protein